MFDDGVLCDITAGSIGTGVAGLTMYSTPCHVLTSERLMTADAG